MIATLIGSRSIRATLALALMAACLAGCSSGRPATTAFEGAVFPKGLRAPDFTLTDQDGRTVSLADYRGQVRLLAFVPPSQPAAMLVAQQIRGALDELGARAAGVKAWVVSTEIASPRAHARTRAAAFLRRASLSGRADLLMGPPTRLRAVWRAYGAAPASAGERALLASTPVVLVDRLGLERVGFPVEQLTPEALAHDLSVLISLSTEGPFAS